MEPAASVVPAGGADPLAAASAEIEMLDQLPVQEQVAAFGRIHAALAAALGATAGTAVSGDSDSATDRSAARGPATGR